jgi:hypothetical protein
MQYLGGLYRTANFQNSQNNAQSNIYTGCSYQSHPHSKPTLDPAKIWAIFHHWIANTLTNLGPTQIIPTFYGRQPAKHEKMNTHSTCLIDYRKQLSGSAEAISEASIVTHRFTNMLKEFTTMINILE